jgi:hypothetical protein
MLPYHHRPPDRISVLVAAFGLGGPTLLASCPSQYQKLAGACQTSLNNTNKPFTIPAQPSFTTMTRLQYLHQALACLRTIMHTIMLVCRCLHALYASSHRVQLRRHSSQQHEASSIRHQALAHDHLHQTLCHVLLLLLHQQQPHHLNNPAPSPLTMDRLPTQLTV